MTAVNCVYSTPTNSVMLYMVIYYNRLHFSVHDGVCGVSRFTCGGGCDSQMGLLWVNAFLAVTFALSGVPMVVDFIVRVSKFSLDTHVLMALAVIGSVLLGLPHEVSKNYIVVFVQMFLYHGASPCEIPLLCYHSQ